MFRILFFIALLSAQILFSQAYIRVGGGYGISASNDNFSTPITTIERTSPTANTIISKENIYGTIGSGATFRLAGGYTFSNNFGVELDMYYLVGDKKYATETSNNTTNVNEISFAYTRQFRIAPSVYVRASKGMVKPYAGFGPVLPLTGFTYLEVDRTDPVSGNNSFYVRKISGNLSIGFESYAGVSMNWPNENFNLFAEIRYTGLRIKSKYSETIQYDIRNTTTGEVIDNLSNLSTFEREINFVDKITRESNAFEGPGGINASSRDFDKPMDKLTSTTNFNALGLNIGVRMNFVRKKSEE
jgi:outer membrane protein W